MLVQFLCIVAASGFWQVSANSVDALKSLEEEYYQWRLQDSPELATSLNVHTYDNLADSVSLRHDDVTKTKTEQFLSRLHTIDAASLPKKQKYDYGVFNYTLNTVVNGYHWREFGGLNPINFLYGIQIDPGFYLKMTNFNTKQDFDNFMARILAWPRQVDEIMDRLKLAVKIGRTMHAVSIARVPAQIDDIITSDPTQFVLFKPFNKELIELRIPTADKTDIKARGAEAMRRFITSLEMLRDYIKDEYLFHTRGTFGVSGWNMGGNYYQKCLQWHLTVDYTAGRVHEIGRREVARISVKMNKIIRRQGLRLSIGEYFAQLKNDSRFHYTNATALLEGFRDIVYNRVYPALPRMFKNLPNRRVKVTEMHSDGPGAYYVVGSSDGSRGGEFQVNTHRVSENQKYAMLSLATHEAVPGHHLQFAYTQTGDLPNFRKEDIAGSSEFAPFAAPGFTSYIEGWALYAESLGEELGLYKDDYELMGRYGYDIWRACRLVVDTGLHEMGWTRDQAIEYLIKYIPLGPNEVAQEVDRYITWPGQACAYKIGELKIKELRQKAKNALGAQFDIKDFHNAVLTHGPIPLGLLEQIIDDWIRSVPQIVPIGK